MSETDGSVPVVGPTVARFAGTGRRRRRVPDPRVGAVPDVETTVPMPAVGSPQHALAPDPALAADPAADIVPEPRPAGADEPWAREVEEPSRVAVRPYVLTGGRTRATRDLPLEALVSVVPDAPRTAVPGGTEHHTVLALCVDAPRSVAEVAALLRLPLGVARVLVGDLADRGAVTVHATPGAEGPDLALMRRVLAGLRKL